MFFIGFSPTFMNNSVLMLPFCLFFQFSTDMPLHVRCSSDPSLVDPPPKEALIGPEEPTKNNLTWSITAGFQKQNHRQNIGTVAGILEQKVMYCSGGKFSS